MFKGRFEQLSSSHMELEKIASEEQANRLSAEARLTSLEEVLSRFRTTYIAILYIHIKF